MKIQPRAEFWRPGKMVSNFWEGFQSRRKFASKFRSTSTRRRRAEPEAASRFSPLLRSESPGKGPDFSEPREKKTNIRDQRPGRGLFLQASSLSRVDLKGHDPVLEQLDSSVV